MTVGEILACTSRPGEPPAASAYERQLAARAAELLPGLSLEGRLGLLIAMDAGEMSACLAYIATAHPQAFDHSLARDRALVERLQDRLDHQYDDDPEPYCSACGAQIGIFPGHSPDWHHYRGEGTAASPVELYDAGHEPAVAWREAGR